MFVDRAEDFKRLLEGFLFRHRVEIWCNKNALICYWQVSTTNTSIVNYNSATPISTINNERSCNRNRVKKVLLLRENK